MDRSCERQLEAKVAEWRATRANTATVQKELLNGITYKTFNSATLMRLQTEMLLRQDQLSEAFAAFDTYVSLQKLALFKAKSGTRSLPDSLEGSVTIFTLLLCVLEQQELAVYARAAKLGTPLQEIVDLIDENCEAAVSGVLARVALARLLMAEDDTEYLKAEQDAKEYFGVISSPQGDTMLDRAEFHFSYALFLALTSTPQQAGVEVKRALEIDPKHLRSALLMIQLLSVDSQQLDTALELAQAYLAQKWKPTTFAAKLTLVQLKKTQIALLELTQGRDVALGALSGFIDLVNEVYADVHAPLTASTKPHRSTTQQSSQSQNSHTHRRFLFGRKHTSELPKVATTKVQETAVASRESKESREVANGWFWIAQQYAKFGLEAEVQEALEEARQIWQAAASSVDETAYVETLRGHLLRESDPLRALQHYRQALVTAPMHVPAAVGGALVLADVNKKGTALPKENETFTLSLLGFMEAICARVPGRFVPEAWYARGLLYDVLGAEETALPMFWRSVELEERRGITSYLI